VAGKDLRVGLDLLGGSTSGGLHFCDVAPTLLVALLGSVSSRPYQPHEHRGARLTGLAAMYLFDVR
jgi:hypothetical protein